MTPDSSATNSAETTDRRRFLKHLGVVSARVTGDLQRFKEFMEAQPAATGAWRGEIHDFVKQA